MSGPRKTNAATGTRARSLVPVALAALGLALLVQGFWIPLKAKLAQQLIASAWHKTLAGESEVKPWSWADTWPVARLVAPGHSPPLYVLAGASGASLAFGPAHVSDSAPPHARGNVAIAGHRDTHFEFLRDLAPGDPLRLETAAGIRDYRVARAEVVHESRTDLLAPTGEASLTLITCFPFDAIVPGGPLRYVVHAEIVEPGGVAGLDRARMR